MTSYPVTGALNHLPAKVRSFPSKVLKWYLITETKNLTKETRKIQVILAFALFRFSWPRVQIRLQVQNHLPAKVKHFPTKVWKWFLNTEKPSYVTKKPENTTCK